MLVRVSDRSDAVLADTTGVDGIEVVVDHDIDLPGMRAVREAFSGTLRLRFAGMEVTPALIAVASTVRADEIAFDAALGITTASLPSGLAAVAVVPSNALDAILRVQGTATAIVLDPGGASRLIDAVEIGRIDAFASACRAAGLPFGLAGGLEAPDVARLLLLEPDALAFDLAVRRDHRADGPLDRQALEAIRALIPREGLPAPAPRERIDTVIDRIFVRDFAIALAIGAYQAEHGTRQRVRFSVEADVARTPAPPHDMRDVFSYDVIIETIRMLSQRPHVTFVETLAEEVANALLGHADLMAVTVKVEKLDVIDGSVGIEITRRRATP